MCVPRLTIEEDLHEADAALDQPPRQQTATAVVGAARIVQSVETPGFRGFAGQVQDLRHRRLHLGRELVLTDTARQFVFARKTTQMRAIDGVKKIELIAL